ncbi:OmpA family protein [uncultured Lentibacter sp.]|jgi:outer membrane protein OmpA-like peptidoglycan-associated protein|uniref:OmpA family protein n=1 Tax=uncultured Lentibacter sp. TaxID=1659309 RepID=UPI0026211A25|nr:OmpA family protein [uncultured Lentibacter sp.]
MTPISKLMAMGALGATVALTGCTEAGLVNQQDPNRQAKEGALLGAAAGALIGAITQDDAKKGAFRGAIVGAGIGGLTGAALDQQERDLREKLGSDAKIVNTGERLIVTMPQDILFATDSASLRPDLTRDIRAVASSLQAYEDSTVQVIGHTDNTGDAGYNQSLSLRRAQAVTAVLASEGVNSFRMQAIGRGEDAPLATNLSPEGRQLNRRVEIVITPSV